MDGWRDILHFDFHGEHVLFSALRLSSYSTFFLASLMTVILCVLEKALSYALSSKWNPLPSRYSRTGNAAFRATLYWIVTLIRLLYMLLAMTFHVGLIIVVVTTLSAGQFVIEYIENPRPYTQTYYSDGIPLLRDDRGEVHPPSEYPTNEPNATSSFHKSKTSSQRRSLVGDANGSTIFTINDHEEEV